MHHKLKGGGHNSFTLYSNDGGKNPIGALAVGAFATVLNSYLNDSFLREKLGIPIDLNTGQLIE